MDPVQQQQPDLQIPAVNVYSQPPEPDPVSVDDGSRQPTPLPSWVTTARAAKVNFGTDIPFPQARDAIANGGEPALRQQVASSIDAKNSTANTQIITALAQDQAFLVPQNLPAIQKLADENRQFTDPKSVFENEYAKKYLDTIYGTVDRSPGKYWLEDYIKEAPKDVKNEVQMGSDLVSKQQYIHTKIENLEAQVKEQSYAGEGADILKQAVPGYYEQKMRSGGFPQLGQSNVPGVGFVDGGLLGSHMEEKTAKLFYMPMDQFAPVVDRMIDDLAKDNPSAALSLARTLYGQSTDDKTLNNLFTILDVTGLPALARLGAGATRAALRRVGLMNATKAVVKDTVAAAKETVLDASKLPKTDPMYRAFVDSGEEEVFQTKAKASSATGDADESAVQKAKSRVLAGIKNTSNPEREAIENLQSGLRADWERVKADPGSVGREVLNRMEENYDSLGTRLFDIIENTARVNRIPGVLAIEDAVRAINQFNKEKYKGLANSIMDFGPVYRNAITNTYHSDLILGRNDATLFGSFNEAQNFANLHKLIGAKPKIKGAGFYLQIPKPLDETAPAVRNYLTLTAENTTPDSWFNLIAKWRTSEDTLPYEQRMQRKTAAYSPNNLMELYKDNVQQLITAHSKFRGKGFESAWKNAGKWKEFDQTLEYAKDAIDPITKEKGYFFASPKELEDHYQSSFHRSPDPIETEAYFQAKSINEVDRVLRNIAVYRYMSRVGAEEHSVYAFDRQGKKVQSDFFSAVEKKNMPGGQDTILVMSQRHGDERLYLGGHTSMNPKAYERMVEEINQGKRRVFEVYDPETRPLQDFSKNVGDERVRYIVTSNAETKPLSYDNIHRRGGGHVMYDYPNYIKQAKVRIEQIGANVKHWYEGDTTLMPMTNRAQAGVIAKHLDEVRKMMLIGDETGAEAYTRHNLPMGWDELAPKFKPTRDVNGKKQPPQISLHEPIQVVPRDKVIMDMNDELEQRYTKTHPDGRKETTLEDGSRRGSLARQYQVEFTGQRDAYEVFTSNDVGTRHNPVFTYEPAKTVNPMAALNRGVRKIVNSTWMDDYKIGAIEHWMQEFGPALSVKRTEWEHSPYHYFNKAEDYYRSALDSGVKDRAEAARYQIKMFTGQPSAVENRLHQMGQTVADWIYEKAGPATAYDDLLGLAKHPSTFKLLPSWALANTLEPLKFLRGMAMHAGMSIFNWPQLLVQNMTYATIFAIHPLHAISGSLGAFLHQLSRVNPAMVDTLDRIASTIGMFKPGEWKEARELMMKRGFHQLSGEHIVIDTAMQPKLISNGWDNFLDGSSIFFKGGDRNVRFGAWYTSHRAFRHEHPTGRITEGEGDRILDHADMLSGNMSTASRSILQTGALSFTSQFLGYTLRLGELMLGKRLSPMQKIRMFTTYSMAFGLPIGLNMTNLPFGDIFRKTAIDNGYIVGDNFLNTAIMEGMGAVGLHYLTGQYYNVGPRMGNAGLDILRTALMGDAKLWDIAGGAPGSFLSQTWEGSHGFRKAMGAMITGNASEYPFKSEDFADIFSGVSTANLIKKQWMLQNYGVWASRNGTTLKNETGSPFISSLVAAAGLQPTAVADTIYKGWTIKQETEWKKQGTMEFLKNMHRYNMAADNRDVEAMKGWYARANAELVAAGILDSQDRAKAISMAAQDDKDLIMRVDENYYLKSVNANRGFRTIVGEDKAGAAADTFGKTLNMREQEKK